MRKSNLTVAITISLLFLSNLSLAGNFTWNGSVNSQWTKSNNWTPSGSPGSTDTIQILSSSNNLLIDANKTVTRLIMSADTLDLGGFTLISTGSSSFVSGLTLYDEACDK